jgi:hypothetical protein
MLPVTEVLVKQLIARTIIGAGMSYIFLRGEYVGNSVYDSMLVGFTVGGVGSEISQCYFENM